MIRVIKPELLLQQRGDRTRKQIADQTGFKVTQQDIYAYEKGVNYPSLKKLPFLLNALGCTFEDVSEPLDMGINV